MGGGFGRRMGEKDLSPLTAGLSGLEDARGKRIALPERERKKKRASKWTNE